MKPQELEDRLNDLAFGVLEMGRLRPGDPTFYFSVLNFSV